MNLSRISPALSIHERDAQFNKRTLNLAQKRAYLRCYLEARGWAVYGAPMVIDGKPSLMRVVLPLAATERRAA